MQSGIFSGLYNVVLSKLNKQKQNKINNIDSLKLLTRNLKYFIIRKEYGFNKNVQKSVGVSQKYLSNTLYSKIFD